MDDAHRREIDVLLHEEREFNPPPAFVEGAYVSDRTPYETAEADRLRFWEDWARQLDWFSPWSEVLQWEAPFAKWFVGGRLNVAHNCLDRHLDSWRANKAALIWEGEPGDRKVLTYRQLHREVCLFANALRKLGVKRGDRVAIYLPMIPEAAIAMLACARLGAPHSVVFGGFSARSLRDRIVDAGAKLVITADGGYRRGQIVPLKRTTDEAIEGLDFVESVVIVRRRGAGDGDESFTHVREGRDHWYHRLIQEASADCPAEEMDSEDPLFILYTSGTTGKPKGIVHSTGGYLTQAMATTKWVFDLKDEDVYWCTADVGWITGHSYIVYGPLALGATILMYEGAPDWPDRGRFWELCEKYGVTVFYTAPTAIRAFMKWGDRWPAGSDLSSLRLLGTVGEPINPEAWTWYHEQIGGGRCPVVDTWWQTETGAIMITPLPGVTITKPGSATTPFPGIDAAILDQEGREAESGYLAITSPWPSMLRGIWGDEQRYRETYWSKFEGTYFPGDGARVDDDGYFWIMGRVDDVLNVAGHRIGTMEVESALVDHPAVAEAAVVGRADEIKGQAIAAFVSLKDGIESSPALRDELREHVVEEIGAIARPADLVITADLPKTRSGKIMRRLLRDIAEGRALGDMTTLADPDVVERLKQRYEEGPGA
ncbi:MAG: acetate--CoA ligase [marine benthic group bacterium]|jgi:acetyl-CoA synthetase|nr:acetate--CoA ligase [Candidatus Carthagonibacter metallireducens]MCL7965745.1 acetate--CoA ligase [Gemmatimonadota bacterium]MCL7969948.1 acetate--CoA ligase [Gemmatimonadota bacterium]MCL7975485.1 acetate--CoA ligase [Gemmatimonadota bacterium]MCL7975792.1 acetate--CoA ligase [Gemmatimonadota bacterium]